MPVTDSGENAVAAARLDAGLAPLAKLIFPAAFGAAKQENVVRSRPQVTAVST
jgi:hypothetical protein